MATALLKSNVLGAWHRSMGADADDQPQDRQRYNRSAVFAPAVIRVGDETYECDVLNVSAGGALIRTRRPFRYSGTFAICIAGLEELRAQLVRTHENNHGIAFEEDPGYTAGIVKELLMNPAYSRDHRSHPRRLVFLAGSFYLGGHYVRCKIQNLSVGGLFVRSEAIADPGEEIELTIARFGVMPVRVVWSNEHGMGCHFLDPPAEIIARIGHLLPASPAVDD